ATHRSPVVEDHSEATLDLLREGRPPLPEPDPVSLGLVTADLHDLRRWRTVPGEEGMGPFGRGIAGGVVVHHQDRAPRPPQGERGAETGGAGTHDHHVDVLRYLLCHLFSQPCSTLSSRLTRLRQLDKIPCRCGNRKDGRHRTRPRAHHRGTASESPPSRTI